jgi:hypothetical protein
MATIADMGIPGVGTGYLQPRQKNRYNVIFAGLGGGVDSQPVSMQAINVSRPSLSFDEIQLDRYTSRAYIAGKYTWEPCKLTIQDDVAGTASAVLQAQQQKQQWLLGAEGQFLAAAGEGSLYKFIIYINILDGNDLVTETWTLEGCWIKDANYGEMDYKDAEAVNIELTVRFDHARQNIVGYTDGPGVALGGPGK